MAERNFDEGAVETEETPGHTFTLKGQQFHTKPKMPVAYFVTEREGLSGIVQFISTLLTPEDRQPFLDLVGDPDSGVVVEEITEISNWLVEVYSDNRPTLAPDSSGAGAQPTS